MASEYLLIIALPSSADAMSSSKRIRNTKKRSLSNSELIGEHGLSDILLAGKFDAYHWPRSKRVRISPSSVKRRAVKWGSCRFRPSERQIRRRKDKQELRRIIKRSNHRRTQRKTKRGGRLEATQIQKMEGEAKIRKELPALRVTA
ncbi:eukaryotic translation initiation factor 2a [Moniliophthora roreri]|nr:eukaryotic translation initiation factor 2a [Moniliophthora roreri]